SETPDWIAELEAACRATSQAAVARRLGVSSGAISALLAGKYKADTASMQQRVEGVLMGRTVACPVLGELRRDRCLEFQSRKFAATNPLRVRLAEACRVCKHRRKQ